MVLFFLFVGLIYGLIGGLFCGIYCASTAARKGYSEPIWFFGGLFLNIIALIAIGVLPFRTESLALSDKDK